ncbi:MAG: tyrosine--tRNA ligase [Candidatus Electryonea clarkiae]|nr:tyrosine--tRNA ligase [Candidatus Electryonea clarkiae]MDP8288226.1 tyrosine--tRNA ligase [Candidatus Electryonea clarkiae]
MMKNLYDILSERGFVEQCTDETGLRDLLNSPQTVYCGFDPTADSFHVGNLVPILGLAHFQRQGHKVIAVLGGATGMIGDPSGRDSERSFLNSDKLESNLEAQSKQIAKLLDFAGDRFDTPAILANNLDWTKDVTLIDWLRGIGKQFSVNAMVAKESVRRRLEERDQGISYTEFSYMLLQAFDFLKISEKYDCHLQVGGGDQWGNITAGIDLIRRHGGKQAYGITFPLLTTSSGQKFGKSEKGAVYIDPERTSVWDHYQFWVRTDDSDVIRHLKMFTFLPMEEIEELAVEVENHPEKREAQKRLAWAVTALVHGEQQADKMKRGAEALYAGRLEELDSELISQVFAEGPTANIDGSRLSEGIPLIELAAEAGLVSSKGEARRMFKQGAMYVNDQRVKEDYAITVKDVLEASGSIILRKGKKNYLVVQVKS